MIQIVDELEQIVACEGARTDTDEWDRVRIARAIDALPGVAGGWWCEHELEVGAHGAIEAEVELLRELGALELAAAPEVAAVIPFATGSVIVRRYRACVGDRLVPARDTTGPFAPAARERFRRDMVALVEHGRIHPYIRGQAHWLVGERTGAIVLNRWSAAIAATPRQRADFLESVDYQLQQRS